MARRRPSVAMVYPSRLHEPTRAVTKEYGHPAHRGFARAVGADTVPLVQPAGADDIDSALLSDLVSAMVSPVPERAVYLLENDSVLYLAPRLKEEFPDSTVILLAAADRLIGERGAVELDGDRRDRGIEPLVDRHLLGQFLRHYCDGVIAVSDLVAKRLRPAAPPGLPIRVVNPYIQPATFAELRAVVPDLASKRAVTVGQWRDHKGIDLLVAAWPAIRASHPGAELRIIGPGHPRAYERTPGVTVRGYLDDLRPDLSAASLYIHPARIEAFGVSVVEALCAGVPALVTETTGAREAVEAVDRSLLVHPSPSGLADGVCEYFDRSLERRLALSARGRQVAATYTETIQTRAFRRQFREVVESVRRTRRSRPARRAGDATAFNRLRDGAEKRPSGPSR